VADIGMETEAVEIFMTKEDGKMGQADGGAMYHSLQFRAQLVLSDSSAVVDNALFPPSLTRPAGPVIRGSRGETPPNNQMGGRERRGSCTSNDTETILKLYQDPQIY
jgi:hypothetical protein